MKTYAVEAGLLDRYLVTVSIQAPRDDDKKKKKKKGEVPGKEMEKEKETEESFVFDLDYFLMNKKVEYCAGRYNPVIALSEVVSVVVVLVVSVVWW